MVAPIVNVPAGVVPSPSRRPDERPFFPTRAWNGPATGFQHAFTRLHVRSSAYVVRVDAASTVINCRPAGPDGRQVAASAAPRAAASSTASDYVVAHAARRAADGFPRHGFTGDADGAPPHVPSRLPGPAGAAPNDPPDLLGLRQPPTRGRADRPRPRGDRRRNGLPAPLHRALPDPPHAPHVRVPRQRRRVDGRGQHVGVQLPLRQGHEALVDARVRRGDRRLAAGSYSRDGVNADAGTSARSVLAVVTTSGGFVAFAAVHPIVFHACN